MRTANRLKTIRVREGRTITELASASEVSTRTVSRAEEGDRTVTAVSKAKIVKGLNKLAGEDRKYSIRDVFPRTPEP
jgi:transcriptional regulator with XRE-family HTH domain